MLRNALLTGVLLLAVPFASAAVARAASGPPPAQQKAIHVVYHLDANGKDTMTALHQIQNQLAVQPNAKIVAVAIGKSVPFLTRDAKTAGGYPFALMIQVLQESDVRFEACDNTMKALGIKPAQLDDGVVVVPSGMAELARLESIGYVYLKP